MSVCVILVGCAGILYRVSYPIIHLPVVVYGVRSAGSDNMSEQITDSRLSWCLVNEEYYDTTISFMRNLLV